MKYSFSSSVDAQYDDNVYNPFVAALPHPLGVKDFKTYVENNPPIPQNSKSLDFIQRNELLSQLSAFFYPMGYMYKIYWNIYNAMRATYQSENSRLVIQYLNTLYQKKRPVAKAQPINLAILGFPGIGKTSTLSHCLALFPQVIKHTSFRGNKLFCKQILYLQVECPSDCSIKTLAINIIESVYKALDIDTTKLDFMRRLSNSALCQKAKSLCLTNHVGILVIDEIQNVILSSETRNQSRPLVKFLVELTNDTNTSICMVGTHGAEAFFSQEEHLCRRTRGLRLLPMKYDDLYISFLKKLWLYQYTEKTIPLTTKLSEDMYKYSAGIPGYIEMIYIEAQNIALFSQAPCITSKILSDAVENLAIYPPTINIRGKSISDFSFPEDSYTPDTSTDTEDQTDSAQDSIVEVGTFLSNRGRKPTERSQKDLVVAYQNGTLLSELEKNKLAVKFLC